MDEFIYVDRLFPIRHISNNERKSKEFIKRGKKKEKKERKEVKINIRPKKIDFYV